MPARRVLLGLAALVVAAAAVVAYLAIGGRSSSTNASRTTSGDAPRPTGSGALSTPSGTGPRSVPTRPGRTALPTGSAAAQLCADATSNYGVAQTYLGLAESGEAQAAQACTSDHRVPVSATERLAHKVFLPMTEDSRASVIDFRATDGTRATVTTARGSDGRYYVTAVEVR